MENIDLILFICLIIPISMMLFLFKDHSRLLCTFLLIGMFLCVLAGEINGLIANNSNMSIQYIAVNISPLVEEILKIIPIIYISFLIKPSKQDLAEFSLSLGVGFATLENISILLNTGTITIGYAVLRALGAGMMHGICTLIVGIAMHSTINKKNMYIPGTIAALCASVIYHSIYNMLISSKFMILGVILPIITFINIIIFEYIEKKKEGEKNEKI